MLTNDLFFSAEPSIHLSTNINLNFEDSDATVDMVSLHASSSKDKIASVSSETEDESFHSPQRSESSPSAVTPHQYRLPSQVYNTY
jgi:hypothetical protein